MKRSLLAGVEVGSLCMSAMFLGALAVKGDLWLIVWQGIATVIIAALVLAEMQRASAATTRRVREETTE